MRKKDYERRVIVNGQPFTVSVDVAYTTSKNTSGTEGGRSGVYFGVNQWKKAFDDAIANAIYVIHTKENLDIEYSERTSGSPVTSELESIEVISYRTNRLNNFGDARYNFNHRKIKYKNKNNKTISYDYNTLKRNDLPTKRLKKSDVFIAQLNDLESTNFKVNKNLKFTSKENKDDKRRGRSMRNTEREKKKVKFRKSFFDY